MREFLVSAANLFLGAECAVCGSAGWGACEKCVAVLWADAPSMIRRTGLAIPVAAANDYRPLLDKMVPVFKDDGALHLAGVLSGRLAMAVAALDPPANACLVPVPSLPSAVRRRGSDHAAVLAAHTGRRLTLRWRPLIRRSTSGLDQRRLGAADRQRNVAGSMRAMHAEVPVVLVDDVCTTGASLIEAVRALTDAGVWVLGGAVVGDADRRRMAPERDFHPGDHWS
ncbi:ComF family protein [Tessaracoccus sp.]